MSRANTKKRTYLDFVQEQQNNGGSTLDNLPAISTTDQSEDDASYAPKSPDLTQVPKGAITNPFRRVPTWGFAHCRSIGTSWKPHGLKTFRRNTSSGSVAVPAAKRQKRSSSPPEEGEVAETTVNRVAHKQAPPVPEVPKPKPHISASPETRLGQSVVGEKKSGEPQYLSLSKHQGDYYRPAHYDNRRRRSRSRSPSRDGGPRSGYPARDSPHSPRDPPRRRSPSRDYRSERHGYYRDRDSYRYSSMYESHTDHHDRYSQRGGRYPPRDYRGGHYPNSLNGERSHCPTTAPKVSERHGQFPTRRYNTKAYGNWGLEDIRKEIKLRRLVMPSSGEAKTLVKVLVYDDDAHKKIVKEASDKTPIIDLERDVMSRNIGYPIDLRSRRQLVDVIASDEARKVVNDFFKRNPEELHPSGQNKGSAEIGNYLKVTAFGIDTPPSTSKSASADEKTKRLKEHKERRVEQKTSPDNDRRASRSPGSATDTRDNGSAKGKAKPTSKVGKEVLRTPTTEQKARISDSSHSSPLKPAQSQSPKSSLGSSQGKTISTANGGARKSRRLQGLTEDAPKSDLVTDDEDEGDDEHEDENSGSESKSENDFIVDDAPKRKQKRLPPSTLVKI